MNEIIYEVGQHVMFGKRELIICGIEKKTSNQLAVYHLCDEREDPFGSVFAEQISPIHAKHTTPYIKNVARVHFDSPTTQTHNKRKRTHSNQRGGKRATRRNKLRKKRRKTNRRR